MMESIGNHLSYLSEYSKPTFQESEKLQEVRWLLFVNIYMQHEPRQGPTLAMTYTVCG